MTNSTSEITVNQCKQAQNTHIYTQHKTDTIFKENLNYLKESVQFYLFIFLHLSLQQQFLCLSWKTTHILRGKLPTFPKR